MWHSGIRHESSSIRQKIRFRCITSSTFEIRLAPRSIRLRPSPSTCRPARSSTTVLGRSSAGGRSRRSCGRHRSVFAGANIGRNRLSDAVLERATSQSPRQLPLAIPGLAVLMKKTEDNMALTSPQLPSVQEREFDSERYILAQGPTIPAGGTLTLNISGLPHRSPVPRQHRARSGRGDHRRRCLGGNEAAHARRQCGASSSS